MDKADLLVRYREALALGKVDCIEPHDIVSYGKLRPMKATEKAYLLNEIHNIERELGMPLTPRKSITND